MWPVLLGLLGWAFTWASFDVAAVRLCEPYTVVERYAARPVLRPLVTVV